MKVVVIIQARMGSTRLPGKVMMRLSGKTVLEHVVSRVRACTALDAVVVATTILTEDDVIVKESKNIEVQWFRGSETDVLARYYQAAVEHDADLVVRVTSDCPLFDHILLSKMLVRYKQMTSGGDRVDYLSNTIIRTFPRGLDVEIISMEALDFANREAKDEIEREHVTQYIRRHPQRFNIEGFTGSQDLSTYRWTLDTNDDLELIKEIYRTLYREDRLFTTDEVLQLIRKRPQLLEVNAHVKQNDIANGNMEERKEAQP